MKNSPIRIGRYLAVILGGIGIAAAQGPVSEEVAATIAGHSGVRVADLHAAETRICAKQLASRIRIESEIRFDQVEFQMQLDPVRSERIRIRQRLQNRMQKQGQALSLGQAAGLVAKSPRDPNRETKIWRTAIGNTAAGNLSPYPDRILDARTLRFPMPRNLRPKALEAEFRHRPPTDVKAPKRTSRIR